MKRTAHGIRSEAIWTRRTQENRILRQAEVFTDRAKYRINNAVMFNEQLMKQTGVTVKDLKTEDGVLAAFEKVKELKVDGAPVIPLQIHGKKYQVGYVPTLQEHFGAMGVDKDGNYRDKIFAPETKHALKFHVQGSSGEATLIRVK